MIVVIDPPLISEILERNEDNILISGVNPIISLIVVKSFE